jgi:CTP:molybdopterin cytidylyltransferase MocA
VTAGLVLAAGAGSRFGETPKQLADLCGRPLLQWAVDAACGCEALDRVVVVLGARAEAIRDAIEFDRAEVVVAEDWADGQSRSLRRGLQELTDADRIVVTLGDSPLVSAAVIAHFAAQPPGTRAVYDGRPGHPVVLGPEHMAAMAAQDGDRGARGLLRDARTIETGHLCSGRDVDTPEDLEEVRDEARAIV